MQTLAPYAQGGIIVADELIKYFLKTYAIPNPEKLLASMQQRAEQVQDSSGMAQEAMQGAQEEAGGGPQ